MKRMAFRMQIRPGTEDEYRRRHEQIWPDMLEALRDAGFHNYSIFRDGSTLFAYFESDNPDETWRTIAATEVNARWQEMMNDLLVVEVDPATGFPMALPEVFHFS